MKIENIAQILLVVGLLGITFSLFFFVVPAENRDLFQICLASIISFISGAVAGVGWGMQKDKKHDHVDLDKDAGDQRS